ncbi:MAG: Hsp20/alpha crystallin family protein [Anaerolineae bacterium]|jgi:HSP20 family protein|nr:Hsp20/alpha crystallin family protein [Anaerolineae bacterium]
MVSFFAAQICLPTGMIREDLMPVNTSPIDPISPEEYKNPEAQFLESGHQNWKLSKRSHTWRPPTDIFENNDGLIIRVEIAGMEENDFEIAIGGKKLTIQGNRPDTPEKRAYHQMEIHYGEFFVDIDLPFPVIGENAEAIYRNGFLHIWLPKAQPRQIPIR